MNVSITAIPSNFDTVVDTISYGIFVFNKNNRPQVNCRNNNGAYGFLGYFAFNVFLKTAILSIPLLVLMK